MIFIRKENLRKAKRNLQNVCVLQELSCTYLAAIRRYTSIISYYKLVVLVSFTTMIQLGALQRFGFGI